MIKQGDRYFSKVWLNPADNKPAVHLITRIANGMVYYRADYGKHDDGSLWLGSVAKFPLEQANKWLGDKVEEEA